eukprot:PITA_28507
MVDCNFVSTPMELNFKKRWKCCWPALANPSEYRQLVGALMFLINSCPNICFALNTLNQFMVDPHHIHWIAAKNLLRYLWGTIHYGLRYTADNLRLHGYSDAKWAGSMMDRKGTSKVLLLFGVCFNILDEQEAKIENHVFHDRSKHIDIRYHFIQDMVQWGAIRLQHIRTNEQVADILTKPLGKVKFLTFRERLGVVERPCYEVPA